MVLAAPALVEAYSVLTRLPPPHRLPSAAALMLLEASFVDQGAVVSLDSRSYTKVLREAAGSDLRGGRVYDSVIAQCARRGKATTLLTFNKAHFAPFADSALEIAAPRL
jgi:predicted nucleic acid-binding protein